jgi:hypothetical protein
MEAVAERPPLAPAGRSGVRTSLSGVAFGIYIAVTLAGLAGIGGGLFPLFYVIASTVAALVAYYRAPARYVVFVFAVWFISPFVRRVFDYHHGYQPASLILAAPVVVTMVSALTLFYRPREMRGSMMYPFTFSLAGVAYGYFVGLLKVGAFPATYALLSWVGPMCFSAHLIVHWRLFPLLRKAFLDFVQWTLPLMGAYGIYQTMRLPAWDKAWLIAADVASVGTPVPFGFRAFGTMATPGPYAVALVICMLFLFGTARRGMVMSLTLALISLLLTRTRAGWVSLVIGLLIIQLMGPVRRMTRNWLFLGFMAAASVPVLSLDVFRESILSRITSFASLDEDSSVRQRLMLSNLAAQAVGARAEGEGLGATGGGTKLASGSGRQASIDNGFLEIFYVLGWPGGSLVLLGLIGQLLTLTRFRDSRNDAFANAARACVWALLSILLIGDIFSGAVGALFWGAYGLACCAHAYNFATGRGLRSRQLAREFISQQPALVSG